MSNEREFSKEELKRTINRSLDDTRNRFVRRGVLAGGGARNWPEIKRCLAEWEARGLLVLLRDPETASSGEVCVEMQKYIDRESSIQGFLE